MSAPLLNGETSALSTARLAATKRWPACSVSDAKSMTIIWRPYALSRLESYVPLTKGTLWAFSSSRVSGEATIGGNCYAHYDPTDPVIYQEFAPVSSPVEIYSRARLHEGALRIGTSAYSATATAMGSTAVAGFISRPSISIGQSDISRYGTGYGQKNESLTRSVSQTSVVEAIAYSPLTISAVPQGLGDYLTASLYNTAFTATRTLPGAKAKEGVASVIVTTQSMAKWTLFYQTYAGPILTCDPVVTVIPDTLAPSDMIRVRTTIGLTEMASNGGMEITALYWNTQGIQCRSLLQSELTTPPVSSALPAQSTTTYTHELPVELLFTEFEIRAVLLAYVCVVQGGTIERVEFDTPTTDESEAPVFVANITGIQDEVNVVTTLDATYEGELLPLSYIGQNQRTYVGAGTGCVESVGTLDEWQCKRPVIQ